HLFTSYWVQSFLHLIEPGKSIVGDFWHYFLMDKYSKHKYFIMPSTVIAAMHYDRVSATLKIIFISGDVYDYKNVPEKIYKAMKTSGSKGTYLNQYIKPNYSFEKVK
ncbi:MAG: KTSC domain-containing protein, partial [Ferruginibacter sp.]